MYQLQVQFKNDSNYDPHDVTLVAVIYLSCVVQQFEDNFKILSHNFNCFKIFPNHILTASGRSGTNSKIFFKIDNFKQTNYWNEYLLANWEVTILVLLEKVIYCPKFYFTITKYHI